MQVTFWGAARTVTGSMHLVEANGLRVLLDCGLFQGRRDEARQRNAEFPFDPRRIDAVVLSHAHIDHCGNLPNLFRQGFSGPIFCTPATHDLTGVMLADAAKIQEEDAAYLNRRADHAGPPIQPLYDRRDVLRMMRLVQPIPYHKPFELGQGIVLHFRDAGHLLGSASVHMTFMRRKSRSLTFTGDLGRKGLPILRDPEALPEGNLIISESTYGGRDHPPPEELPDQLFEVIDRTIQRGGKVVVPAFSLGRTQSMLFTLHQLFQAGRLRDLPVFVDSPLAAAATEVFRAHSECFDEETSLLLQDEPDVFGEKRVRYVRDVEESKSLNGRRDPCLLISASGMCESGRIVHHLKHNIEDAKNTILIIGFQAPHTLGRRIVERRPEVRIHGRQFRLNAEVVILNGFSSHADRKDLIDALGPLAAGKPMVRLVHGEVDQATALAASLKEKGFRNVSIPDRGETTVIP